MVRVKKLRTLVTGASSGIGRAISLRLAESGAAVALVARRRPELEQLASHIHTTCGDADTVVLEADLRSGVDANRAVADAAQALGGLDVVINNAGVLLVGPALDAPLSEWQKLVDTNMLGMLYVSHAALPHLAKSAAGPRKVADLVNIGSTAGRIPAPYTAVYNATKYGVNGFSAALRAELAAKCVRVSVVEPGLTATELPTHIRPEVVEQLAGDFGSRTPMDPDDVARAVEFIIGQPPSVSVPALTVTPTSQID